ncbi:MAG TPA: hypothetical protein VJ907_03030 [Halanaerobiales bacterium]|nr:hypothetical protein [Halanaerobiales bacterium]
MSLQLEEVSRIEKLLFLKFNAVNMLIYCNKKEGIEPIFTEISKLAKQEVQFDSILDLIDQHVSRKVILNKKDIDIIEQNANNNFNFNVLNADDKKVSKYIFVST